MHKYLRAIGFSDITTKKQLVELLQNLIDHYESINEYMYTVADGTVCAEIKTYYGDNFGIIWYGSKIGEGELELDYFVPFIDGDEYIYEEQPSIERKKDVNSFIGVCDDIKIGISLIFQVLNNKDCQRYIEEDIRLEKPAIAFSCLSTGGTILLPVNKGTYEDREQEEKRYRLIELAKKGDENAIETLTLEDIDTYSKLSRRIRHEDVFSIVESSFMPYGLECDLYTVVCDILSAERTINVVTKEELYNLGVICNGLKFNIAINVKDVTGEPLAGRRFKGNVWLQGNIKDMALSE